MLFHVTVDGVDPVAEEFDADEWAAAQRLFINDVGLQDASASYGVVFAGGAAVSAIGTRIENQRDINLTNVSVHGLRSHVREKFKVYGAATTVTMRGFFRDTLDWEAMTDDFTALSSAKYVGDAWEDVVMATALLDEGDEAQMSWSLLYTLQIEQFVRTWVKTGDSLGVDLQNKLDVHCGTDIQVHSVKGAIGVRIDGADDLAINGLSVSDIESHTPLGSMVCGEYTVPEIAGEEAYIQPGFNGHRAHGLTVVYTSGSIRNVQIENVRSLYGDAYGLRVFDGCDIELGGAVDVSDVSAGVVFEDEGIDMAFMAKSTTNPLPRACGVYVYSDAEDVRVADGAEIMSARVSGYRECVETVLREDEPEEGENGVFVASEVGECVECVVKEMYRVDDEEKVETGRRG